jgi:hypothetical protein
VQGAVLALVVGTRHHQGVAVLGHGDAAGQRALEAAAGTGDLHSVLLERDRHTGGHRDRGSSDS